MDGFPDALPPATKQLVATVVECMAECILSPTFARYIAHGVLSVRVFCVDAADFLKMGRDIKKRKR